MGGRASAGTDLRGHPGSLLGGPALRQRRLAPPGAGGPALGLVAPHVRPRPRPFPPPGAPSLPRSLRRPLPRGGARRGESPPSSTYCSTSSSPSSTSFAPLLPDEAFPLLASAFLPHCAFFGRKAGGFLVLEMAPPHPPPSRLAGGREVVIMH